MVLGMESGTKHRKFLFHTYMVRKKIKAGDIIVVIGKESDIERFKTTMERKS